MQHSRWPWHRFWLLAVVAACAGAAVYFIDPTVRWLPKCPFFAITGLYCPGCGTFRALHRLTHGNLLGAATMNPLLVAVLPVLGYALYREICSGLGVKAPGPLYLPGRSAWALPVVIIVYWIARNLPVYPFFMLAPH